MDRRKRKTVHALKRHVITLLHEKPLQDITVTELCHLADISRSTFYLHFKDIHELYQALEEDLLNDFQELIDETIVKKASVFTSKEGVITLPHQTSIYQYIKKNAELALLILTENGDNAFFNKIYEQGRISYNKLLKVKTPITEYYYDFMASAFIGLIRAWMRSGMKESPEKMSQLANEFAMRKISL
ncbi:TetR/AcrR family transcriptional regulator [Guggenheimella bovis]